MKQSQHLSEHEHEQHEHNHHEHSHGESCSCGHHHEHSHHEHNHHEHSHDESCSCGHHHEHEHDHSKQSDSEKVPPATLKGTTKVYILENLGCAHCAAKMEEQIAALPGIEYASITFATKQLRISAANPEHLLPEIKRICQSIESEVEITERTSTTKHAASENTQTSDAQKQGKKSSSTSEYLPIMLGAVSFAAGILLEHLNVPEILSCLIFIAGYLILGSHILLKAGKNILHGQIFDENFLMCIATLGAFVIKEYPEAVGVMLFYRIGEFFEEKAVERSRGQIMEAIDLRPEVVQRLNNQHIETIPTEDARIGDFLLVRPGDRIPLDGIVVEGSSRIDTSPITGEPVPVSVSEGDALTSGCINTVGQLIMKVEKTLSESMVTRILDSVENAAASKPRIDRFITRFAKVYTPIVVFAAASIAIIPSLITKEWHYWIYTALTFLVMSCPCALVLSVPLAFFSGIGAGSKKGILFKGGLSMESLTKVKAVVMDKTGTITKGTFELQEIVAAANHSAVELLQICASCEQYSTHPIAISIVTAAKEKKLPLTENVQIEELAGRGIIAHISNREILCGNEKLLQKYGISVNQAHTVHGAEVFIAIDHTYAGYMRISDTIKNDAVSAIQKLKNLGLKTVMLTGDSEANAKEISSITGIDRFFAKLLPQDKLTTLQEIRKDCGAILFVGDGINDAPVLAGADVGAAMGSGADAAIEAADVVYMNGNVESIPESIAIAKKANSIALQNVVFALCIKLIVMILGLIGHANMWLAVFADTGVAMICVLNSIRNLYTK